MAGSFITTVIQLRLIEKFKDDKNISGLTYYKFLWPLPNRKSLCIKYVSSPTDRALFSRIMKLRTLNWIFIAPVFLVVGMLLIMMIHELS